MNAIEQYRSWHVWGWNHEQGIFFALRWAVYASTGNDALAQAKLHYPQLRNLAVSPATEPRNLK